MFICNCRILKNIVEFHLQNVELFHFAYAKTMYSNHSEFCTSLSIVTHYVFGGVIFVSRVGRETRCVPLLFAWLTLHCHITDSTWITHCEKVYNCNYGLVDPITALKESTIYIFHLELSKEACILNMGD